jgi:hypothetical protein
MTLYLPTLVEEKLAAVPLDGRSVFVQMAILHYLKSAEGIKTIGLLEQGYKPSLKT